MTNREIFQKNLPYYMNLARVNQSELAKAIDVSKSTVTCWVKGKAYPRIDVIQRIADYLGCSTDELVTGKKPSTVLLESTRPYTADNKISKLVAIYESLTADGQEYLIQQAEIASKLYRR